MFKNLEFNITQRYRIISQLYFDFNPNFWNVFFFLVLADGLALLPIKYYVTVIEKLRQMFQQQMKHVELLSGMAEIQ